VGDGDSMMFQDFRAYLFERNERESIFDDMVILHAEINIRYALALLLLLKIRPFVLLPLSLRKLTLLHKKNNPNLVILNRLLLLVRKGVFWSIKLKFLRINII
jgi:hypothetical protein